jgi:hypothetical protein
MLAKMLAGWMDPCDLKDVVTPWPLPIFETMVQLGHDLLPDMVMVVVFNIIKTDDSRWIHDSILCSYYL